MRVLTAVLVVCGSIVITGSAPICAQEDRPNVVLIIADDMGRHDCGAYGNLKVKTPHIDRLAREGMRFDRAFVTASSCSPSRSSMITGRYPHNTGAEELHSPLPREQVTFVEKLRAAGYWTAQAGKWHLGELAKARFEVIREANVRRATGGDSGAVQSGCDQWVPVLRDRPKGKRFFLWLAAIDPHRDYERGRSLRRTVPRMSWFHPTFPIYRQCATTWHSTTTRSAGSITMLARCLLNWTGRGSRITQLSCF